MRILALDAAGFGCSVALLDGGRCLAERAGGDSRAATAALPPLVASLLAGCAGQVDAVAATVGPGSFTGLRGALALAHGLAAGFGVPLVGVTVAEALRDEADPALSGPSWVALDARRPGLVFLDAGGGMAAVRLDALPVPAGPVTVMGDGAEAVCAILPGATARGPRAVSAAAVARAAARRLAGGLGPCDPWPLYLGEPAVTGRAPA